MNEWMNPVYDEGHSIIAVLFTVFTIYAASQSDGKITKIHIMIRYTLLLLCNHFKGELVRTTQCASLVYWNTWSLFCRIILASHERVTAISLWIQGAQFHSPGLTDSFFPPHFHNNRSSLSTDILFFIVGSYLKKRDPIISSDISSLMVLRERIAVCSVRQTNITNKLCGRNIV